METKTKNGYTLVKDDGLEYFKVAPGVWGMKIVFVNVYIVCEEKNGINNWVLIDAGLRGAGNKIKRFAEHIFGEGATPSSILLTHGHFDHVGALEELLEFWNVPVYAHYLELPYLKGISSYPPPDPMVGGGLMSLMSWMFPRRAKDFGKHVHRLNIEGTMPGFAEWKFLHCPGHSPGQVAFFRESDRVLIAGDTFVTTRQESVFSVITQKKILSGPPKYFTIDWVAAKSSVEKLAALVPEAAATGHGYPMYGEELRVGLTHLVQNFEEEAVPDYGRYVNEPARTNKNGVQYIPGRVTNPLVMAGVALVGALTTFGMLWQLRRRKLI